MTRPTRAHRRMRRRYRTALAVMAGAIVTVATVTVGATITAPSQGVRVTCADTTQTPTVQPDGAIGCTAGSTSTSTASSTTSTSTATTTTTTTTLPPTTATCGAPISRTITGDQAQKFAGSIPSSATTSATGAVWRSSNVGDYAVTVTGGTGACWSGGRIIGEWGDGDAWSLYHYRGGFRCDGAAGLTVENMESTGYGDAFKFKGGCNNFTLRHVFSDHAADDGIENDYLNSGRVENSLIEAYVGISTRASSGQGTVALGPVTFDRVLLKLEPQPNVYKGTSPGNGGFFKYGGSSDPVDPPFVLIDSVFYAQQKPNHQDLGPPESVTCRGNTVLWANTSEPFPAASAWLAKCPDTRIVTGAAALIEWDVRRTAWMSHP